MSRRLLFLMLLSSAVPAAASVTVIGNSAARRCYEAADSDLPVGTRDIAECDKALREDPLTPHEIVATYVNRGILQLRRNATAAALADFDEAIERDPREPEAYLNKGAALLRNPADPKGALPMFVAALENNTSKPALAYYGRGLSYELLGDVRSAYFDYKRASELDPEWEQPRQELVRFTVSNR